MRPDILRRPLRDESGDLIMCAGCMQRPKQPATHLSPDSREPCCDACQPEIDAWVTEREDGRVAPRH
jgi:hypothetical protein